MTTQRLADGVLPDVVATAGTLSPDSLRPVGGRIDLAPIAASEPAVVRAASRLATEAERVQRIDPAALAPQIAQPVEELQTRIADATDLADPYRRRPAAADDAGEAVAVPTCSCSRTTRRSVPRAASPVRSSPPPSRSVAASTSSTVKRRRVATPS